MDEGKQLKMVCKNCESITDPRILFDDLGVEVNSECRECGGYLGKIDGLQSELMFLGEDNGDPVYIRHTISDKSGDMQNPPSLEDYR